MVPLAYAPCPQPSATRPPRPLQLGWWRAVREEAHPPRPSACCRPQAAQLLSIPIPSHVHIHVHVHVHVPRPTCTDKKRSGYLHYTSSGFSERTKQKRRYVSRGRWWHRGIPAAEGRLHRQQRGQGRGPMQLQVPVAAGGAPGAAHAGGSARGTGSGSTSQSSAGGVNLIKGSDGEGMRAGIRDRPRGPAQKQSAVGSPAFRQASLWGRTGCSHARDARGRLKTPHCAVSEQMRPPPLRSWPGPRWCSRSKARARPCYPVGP